ncbi:hypothetical protein NG726_11750 [Pseudomonas sp. MOB-449]|nr:hypothetical protein [Pseudomonas sp. MOB-449]
MANRHQRTKRKLTLISALMAAGLYGAILFLPAIAGQWTAEQPVGAYTAAR